MNTNTSTAPAPGSYEWTRPHVALRVQVSANGGTTGTLTNEVLGTVDLAELAAPALAEVLAGSRAYTYTPAPVVYLTRQRAKDMHRTLAALGINNEARYLLAAEVVGRAVESLTALTEQEGRAVWLEAVRQYDAAQEEATANASREELNAIAEEWLH